MAANNALIVTDLNYDSIRENLTSYLSSQSEFQDYDFEASGMQTIISMLAYNTYYNSIYTNMVSNEMFLDSALIRNNVVSRAKMLGFTPGSARGARATIRVSLDAPEGSPTTVVPANTIFRSTIDGIQYTFSTIQDFSIAADANNNYISNLTIREGDHVRETYTVDSNAPVDYLLNNENCDTTSLKVSIQQSVSNTNLRIYTRADDILHVTGNSAVYFLQENIDGKFQVLFGDGILGKKPADGNIVKLDYTVCNGTATNGTRVFQGPERLGGYTYSFTVPSPAQGGSGPQSIDSIKFNAPRNYTAQNRAVTVQDYRNLLLNEAPDLQTISVWGGEQNKPPIYGKVYISAKPKSGNILTALRKAELTEFLSDYNMMTLEPVFVDATFLYIVPTITLTYNSNRTAKSPETLINQCDSVLSNFQTEQLGTFKSTFYDSQLTGELTKIDDSIIAATVSSVMQKRFIPVVGNVPTAYVLNFGNQIYNPHAGHKYAISSSQFTTDGYQCYFDDDGNGTLRIYRIEAGKRVYVDTNAGTVDYPTGTVSIDTLRMSAYQGDAIKVQAVPANEDITTIRNQIPLLADATITIKDTKTATIVATATSTVSTTQATSPSDIGLNLNSYVY